MTQTQPITANNSNAVQVGKKKNKKPTFFII